MPRRLLAAAYQGTEGDGARTTELRRQPVDRWRLTGFGPRDSDPANEQAGPIPTRDLIRELLNITVQQHHGPATGATISERLAAGRISLPD
jgi:hypothetical protein